MFRNSEKLLFCVLRGAGAPIRFHPNFMSSVPALRTFWMVAWQHLAALFESPVQRIGVSDYFMEDLHTKG
jgi:hypothetical protein